VCSVLSPEERITAGTILPRFSPETHRFFQKPSAFTNRKAILFFVLCRFSKAFRSIWKWRKNLPFMPFSSFTNSSKKAHLFPKCAVFLLSCYNEHGLFRKNFAGNSVFRTDSLHRSTVFLCNIPDAFAFFRKAKDHCCAAVLNFPLRIY